jgi:hypothetical protein
VALHYRSRSYGEDWRDVDQEVPIDWTPCRFGGERLFLSAPYVQMASIVAIALQNFMRAVRCLRAVAAIGLHMKVSWKRVVNEGLGGRKRFGYDWERPQTCSIVFLTSLRVCAGGPTIGCAVLRIRRGHDRSRYVAIYRSAKTTLSSPRKLCWSYAKRRAIRWSRFWVFADLCG